MSNRRFHELLSRISRYRIDFVIVGVMCIVITGVPWLVKRSVTPIYLSVTTNDIQCRLAESLVLNTPIELTRDWASINRIRTFATALINGTLNDSSSTDISIKGGRIKLAEMVLPSSEVIRINTSTDSIMRLTVSGPRYSGILQVIGSGHMISQGPDISYTYPFNISFPRMISYAADGNETDPAIMTAKLYNPIAFEMLPIDSLSFARHDIATLGVASFGSSIVGGTITLPEIDKTISIMMGDRITLVGIDGTIHRITVSDHIDMSFAGRVKEIWIGPEKYNRNITPSILEYIYHKQRIILLLNAIVFVWSVLWGIRKR